MPALRLPDLEEQKPPLQPEAPVLAELPDGNVRISWNGMICPVPVKVYSLKVRLRDGPWQRIDAGVSPAVLVRKGGKGVRAPANEVIVAEMCRESTRRSSTPRTALAGAASPP